MRINMSVEDPANGSTYKARSDKYEGWQAALYEAESKKSWTERIWQWFFGPTDEHKRELKIFEYGPTLGLMGYSNPNSIRRLYEEPK
jgi:hypothetical protein